MTHRKSLFSAAIVLATSSMISGCAVEATDAATIVSSRQEALVRTFRGVLERRVAVGAETTGYGLRQANGDVVEVDLETERLEAQFVEGRTVSVSGRWKVVGGVESGRRIVLVVTDILPDEVKTAPVSFLRDDRPVDGVLRDLRLVANPAGTYRVTLRSAFYDRINGRPVDGIEELMADAKCTFGASAVTCVQDTRLVDGPLYELSVTKSSVLDACTYDAALTITSSGFGVPITTTVRELGTNLARVE